MKKLIKLILSSTFTSSISISVVSCAINNNNNDISDKDKAESGCIDPIILNSNINNNNDNSIVTNISEQPENDLLYRKWKSANPNRNENVINRSSCNNLTYYSPYLDAGMYEGIEMKNVVDKVGLNHLTLAFVQQVNKHNNYLDLSIAGIESSGDAFDWWAKEKLYNDILKPIIDSNNFNNIKIAYGGATTGGYIEKNPWNLALKLSNGNKVEASKMLENSLVKFNKDLSILMSELSKKDLLPPMNIDFDIEGAAQNDKESNIVLANTLANMKKNNDEWNFSITLPVLPTGLTTIGVSVMDIFIEAYKNNGLEESKLPIINLMLMDYGNQIYIDAINEGLTNFDLAKLAIENTKSQLKNSIIKYYNDLLIEDNKLFELIGATPMIGVNDTVKGVFTLEDAKDLFNYSQLNRIAYIGIWSMNDDRGRKNNKIVQKDLTSHGLNYLEEYDFSKALIGNWDNDVLHPKKEI